MSYNFGEILLGTSTISQAIPITAPKYYSSLTVVAPTPVNLPAPVLPTPITLIQTPSQKVGSLTPSLTQNLQNLTQSTLTANNGAILPTKVYQNNTQPYFIPYSEISSLQGTDVSTIQTIVSSLIQPVLTTSTLTCDEVITNLLSLDNAFITANNTELLLNGIPLATTSNISSLADWSLDPAISTVNIDYNDIINVKNLSAVDLITNTLNVNQAFISDLTVYQQTTENFASTFTIEARDIYCSSINVNDDCIADNGIFSTITVGTLSSLSSIGNAGYFGNLTALTLNGQPYAGGSNWSQFPATQAVSMNQNPLNGGSNFAINSSNLTITGSNQISNVCRDYSVVADEGINIASPSRINLTAQNGTYGEINLTANGGFNNAINGAVNITANGSQVGGVGQGGSINLVANTPSGFSNLTSKISLNASGINSYAGVIPPIASLAGYNFIYGTGGVNICAGLPPGALPNTVGTTYIYGTTGVEVPSQAYMSGIEPYWDGLTTPPDLNITGRYILPNLAQVYVNMSNVKNIYMEGGANIQNVKTLNMSNTGSNVISNVNTLYMATGGTVNNLQSLNMPGGGITGVLNASIANITNLQTINGSPYSPGSGGITSAQLTSTTTGLGTLGYISSSQLASTVKGLQTISSFSTLTTSTLTGNTAFFRSLSSTQLLGVSSIYGYKNSGSSNFYSRILEFDYNPPTAVGGIELCVSATPGVANGIVSGSLGVDLQQGATYLQSVWDGYISMPMNFYGANFSFQSDNDYCLFIDGKAGAPATLSTSHDFYMASTITQKNQHIVANNRQPFIQYGTMTGTGANGNVLTTLSTAYANTNYVVQTTMQDANPANISAVVNSPSTFTMYWANGGGGSQTLAFTTFGNL